MSSTPAQALHYFLSSRPLFFPFLSVFYSMTGGSKSSLPCVDVLHYFDAVMVDVDVDGYEISPE